jgi:hypothetical protein
VAEAVLLCAQIALNIVLPAWLVRRDMRRLGPRRLARAWNDASFWVAVVVFGRLCLPVHAIRTRRSLAGIGLGVAWLLGTLLVEALVSLVLATALGVEG